MFRAILVTGVDDETIVVDLGYDYRDNPPVRIEGIGPVLDVEDIVTGKVRAFIERGAERDYSDITSTAFSSRRWSAGDLLDKGKTLFPDMTEAEFADRLDHATSLDPVNYAAIGIGPSDLAALQGRLTAAGNELLPQRLVQKRPQSPILEQLKRDISARAADLDHGDDDQDEP